MTTANHSAAPTKPSFVSAFFSAYKDAKALHDISRKNGHSAVARDKALRAYLGLASA